MKVKVSSNVEMDLTINVQDGYVHCREINGNHVYAHIVGHVTLYGNKPKIECHLAHPRLERAIMEVYETEILEGDE